MKWNIAMGAIIAVVVFLGGVAVGILADRTLARRAMVVSAEWERRAMANVATIDTVFINADAEEWRQKYLKAAESAEFWHGCLSFYGPPGSRTGGR